jgi:transposase
LADISEIAVWTSATRAQHTRVSNRYLTDLTDAEWGLIAGFLPPARSTGRPRAWPPREIMNAIFYVLRGGIAWRLLPRDLPPWQTVYRWFSRLRDEAVFERMNQALVMATANASGARPVPVQPSSTARESRPRKAAVRTASTQARRSRGASATRWSTSTAGRAD